MHFICKTLFLLCSTHFTVQTPKHFTTANNRFTNVRPFLQKPQKLIKNQADFFCTSKLDCSQKLGESTCNKFQECVCLPGYQKVKKKNYYDFHFSCQSTSCRKDVDCTQTWGSEMSCTGVKTYQSLGQNGSTDDNWSGNCACNWYADYDWENERCTIRQSFSNGAAIGIILIISFLMVTALTCFVRQNKVKLRAKAKNAMVDNAAKECSKSDQLQQSQSNSVVIIHRLYPTQNLPSTPLPISSQTVTQELNCYSQPPSLSPSSSSFSSNAANTIFYDACENLTYIQLDSCTTNL